jgi:SAM-dependent methyltransferase
MNTYDQERMWAFHQNENVDSFRGAAPRLQGLAGAVFRLARRRRIGRPLILNIGVGNGRLEELVIRGGGCAYSLDPDVRALGRLTAKGVNCCVGVIQSLPFSNNALDFVIVSEVLEHLGDEDRGKGLTEISRVLKPGGYILGTVPYREDLQASLTCCPHCGEVFHRWGHKKEFDIGDVRRELAPHFQIEKITRTVFVSFSHASAFSILKSLVRFVLAKSGEAIAVPSIYFVGKKR